MHDHILTLYADMPIQADTLLPNLPRSAKTTLRILPGFLVEAPTEMPKNPPGTSQEISDTAALTCKRVLERLWRTLPRPVAEKGPLPPLSSLQIGLMASVNRLERLV